MRLIGVWGFQLSMRVSSGSEGLRGAAWYYKYVDFPGLIVLHTESLVEKSKKGTCQREFLQICIVHGVIVCFKVQKGIIKEFHHNPSVMHLLDIASLPYAVQHWPLQLRLPELQTCH